MPDSGGFTRRQGFAGAEEVEAAHSRFETGGAGSFGGVGRRDAGPGGGNAPKARKAAAAVAAAAAAELAGELDDSDELSGSKGAYRAARAAARAGERRRAKTAAGQDAGSAEVGPAGPGHDPVPSESPAHDAAERKAPRVRGSAEKPRASARAEKGLGGRPARKRAAKAEPPSALEGAQSRANWAKSRAAADAAGKAGAAASEAGSSGGIAAAAASAGPVAAGILAGIAAFVAACLVASSFLGAIAGFWEDERAKAAVEGLPPYITYDMVLAALECQEEYGHPAGCTIAQIICESGQGDSMSMLAERDSNLFGIKWSPSFAACPEVRGKSSWSTREEVSGAQVTVMADFTVFKGAAECIRFRSRVLLQSPRYAGNALIKEAIAKRDSDKMAEGLKDAGYATDSGYVESLKSVMVAYGLYRFDGMAASDLEGAQGAGDAIVRAAFSQLGVPYVWGGESPGKGLDCSGLTQYCYRQAGIRISHYTEDQRRELTAVPLSQARPGDILYRPGHVAIYIGGDEYIHEPHTGDVCRKATGIASFACALRHTG